MRGADVAEVVTVPLSNEDHALLRRHFWGRADLGAELAVQYVLARLRAAATVKRCAPCNAPYLDGDDGCAGCGARP